MSSGALDTALVMGFPAWDEMYETVEPDNYRVARTISALSVHVIKLRERKYINHALIHLIVLRAPGF